LRTVTATPHASSKFILKRYEPFKSKVGVNMSIGCSGMEFEYFVTIENLVCHFRTYFSKYKI